MTLPAPHLVTLLTLNLQRIFQKLISKTEKSYGLYLVGSEIAAGNWRSSGNSDDCYWSITDNKGEIIDNHFGMAGGTMYIPSNAFQVELDKECGTWEYLGN